MGVEIPLERVNTMHFNQSVFERITGSGDLVIESGGEDGQQRFTDIRRPDQVQNDDPLPDGGTRQASLHGQTGAGSG